MRPPHKPIEQQVGSDIAERLRASPRFIGKLDPEPFYFREVGDFIKGELVGENECEYPVYMQKLYQFEVWAMRQDGVDLPVTDGLVINVPGYKWLRRYVTKCRLMHSVIRVVFTGRIKTAFGNAAYAFDVFKDTGTFQSDEEKQDGTIRKRSKRKSPGSGQPEPGRSADDLKRRIAAARARGGTAKQRMA